MGKKTFIFRPSFGYISCKAFGSFPVHLCMCTNFGNIFLALLTENI